MFLKIFTKLSQRVEENYKLKVSFLEIRNETVRDLLCKNDCLKTRPVGRIPITVTVNSADESLKILHKVSLFNISKLFLFKRINII